ncbi:SCO family protein [Patiriisocius marinistellae]|uniref:SCO family protein n=1 Tax=Patiriisocius marinistellae TaxID=2494560 RepID=A0A5J4FT80_9FLAO|nr:SCO family protein [Patiriisocius marinistellae]GEQ84750.1 SCO family protein [Patiriisocius marinistellae]
MLQFFSKYKFLGIVLLVLSAITISIIYTILKPVEVLPIYQPSKVNAEMVDPSIQHQKKYHTVGDFSLTNQNGKTITQADFNDKIYVADFFFTTCQTICPIMTDNMEQLQNQLKNNAEVKLLSHTVMPEYDTPERLKEYAIKKGVDDSKWNLVTGDKLEIYNLARKQYLAAKENPGDPLGLVHTENFVLVDKQKRIRGFYDGTVEEDMDKVLNDIDILQNEGKKSLFFGLFHY